MTFLQMILIFLVVTALSIGQVLFKLAAAGASGFNLASLLSGRLIVALCVYGLATLLWLAVLRITPLRLAYPFAALAFVIVPLLAHYWIGEPLRLNTFIGAAVILAGVWISVGWG